MVVMAMGMTKVMIKITIIKIMIITKIMINNMIIKTMIKISITIKIKTMTIIKTSSINGMKA